MKHIDFLARRKYAGIISVILFVGSLVWLNTKGVEKGVDFEGGSKLTVLFQQKDVDINTLREHVGTYEDNAQIVSLVTTTGRSEFTIKIAKPKVEESSSNISPERRQRLEQAFAGVINEDQVSLSFLKGVNEEDMAAKLASEDIYSITEGDAVKTQTYNDLAARIKSNVEGAATLINLAEAADNENAANLARGIVQAYPALNRTTDDKLNAVLKKYNPLGRAFDASYKDISTQVLAKRADLGDFFDNTDFLANIKVGDGEKVEDLVGFINDNFILGGYRIEGISSFSASIAAELLTKAWEAVVIALLGILAYIALRFNRAYAVASVVALTHDVIIALGVFAISGAELSNPVVAAFLTIVGYSLNDTIVVFDRIRENLGSTRHPDVEQVINTSINQTLSRTLVTSLTTLFVVLVIYFFSGDETLKTFSFPLLVGIFVGTYSSIFIASPVLLLWHNRLKSILN